MIGTEELARLGHAHADLIRNEEYIEFFTKGLYALRIFDFLFECPVSMSYQWTLVTC